MGHFPQCTHRALVPWTMDNESPTCWLSALDSTREVRRCGHEVDMHSSAHLTNTRARVHAQLVGLRSALFINHHGILLKLSLVSSVAVDVRATRGLLMLMNVVGGVANRTVFFYGARALVPPAAYKRFNWMTAPSSSVTILSDFGVSSRIQRLCELICRLILKTDISHCLCGPLRDVPRRVVDIRPQLPCTSQQCVCSR